MTSAGSGGSVTQSEFGEYLTDVNLHDALGQAQGRGDVAVEDAAGYEGPVSRLRIRS